MIDHHIPKVCIINNTALVLDNGLGIDTGSNGPTSIDFCLDLGRNMWVAKDGVASVFRDGSVGKDINFFASITAGTGAARVHGIACGIDVTTKAIGRFRTAGQIWLARIIGNISLGFHKLIDTRVRSAVAAICRKRENAQQETIDLDKANKK